MTTETPRWFTSSYSGNGGQCIEVAVNLVAPHRTVPVRDSKNPAGPVLGFPAHAFTAFIAGVKAGTFGAV
ncbi:DUF397 domain-containing protein [Streptomyces sp. N50]|uniref:DUF397 domain-containing protein n=1 Tax=Streptomyces sp. N50 TaxID=3081765 RepID=UPI0029622050|nr:DUF397 domain-containing protein [Streptomyces sp. N50]WOX11192.1 DUF397 domain-containing protein [Streptomyces sp. N50]